MIMSCNRFFNYFCIAWFAVPIIVAINKIDKADADVVSRSYFTFLMDGVELKKWGGRVF